MTTTKKKQPVYDSNIWLTRRVRFHRNKKGYISIYVDGCDTDRRCWPMLNQWKGLEDIGLSEPLESAIKGDKALRVLDFALEDLKEVEEAGYCLKKIIDAVAPIRETISNDTWTRIVNPILSTKGGKHGQA